MNRWLRLGSWAVLALVLLWVVLEVVSIVLGIVSFLLKSVVSILVVALVLYLAYLGVSKLFGDSGGRGGSRSREKEKIFE